MWYRSKPRWLRPCLAGAQRVMPLAALALLAGCTGDQRVGAHTIRLAGSALSVELVESWLQRSPQARFNPQRVQFHLASHGFNHLRDGTCDLACTDRPPADAELRAFTRRIAGRRVGFYAYALYVHPSNPIDSAFARDIGPAFAGKRGWKDLGGEDAPIRLFGPSKSSRGGLILCREARIFMAKAPWQVCERSDEVIAAVASDPTGLGFAEVGHDRDARYLGIRMSRNGPPVFPSLEAIEHGDYPLAELVYVYYTEPARPAVMAALDYLFSDAGREALRATRVWPIPIERAIASATP